MAKMTEQEWLAKRLLGVGGSEIHNVLNEPPYGCALKLFREKRKEPEDYPIDWSGVMRRGQMLEGPVADLYAEETGKTVVQSPHAQSKDRPWEMVSIDRVIFADDDQPTGALEVKTMERNGFWAASSKGLPTRFIMQLQWGMMVKGYSWGAFAIFWPDGGKLIHFPMQADPKLHAEMRLAVEKFWRQVENGPAPDPLDASDARCKRCQFRERCQGAKMLDAAKSHEEGDVVVMNEMSQLVSAYDEFRDLEKEAKESKEEMALKIKTMMGDTQVADCSGFRVNFRAFTVNRFQGAQFKKDHPALHKTYTKASTQRPLKITAK